MNITVSSDYLPVQSSVIGLYNYDCGCLLRGSNGNFI